MSEVPEQEPVRWLDDPGADASLRADLVHAAGATTTGVDYAASLVALRSAIAAQTGAVAPAAAAGTSFGFKAIIGGLLVAGAAGVWALRGDARGVEPPTATSEIIPTSDVVATSDAVVPSEVTATPRPAPQTSAPAPVATDAALPDRDPDPTPEPSRPSSPGTAAPDPAAVDSHGARETADADASPRPELRRPRPPQDEDDRFLREAKLVAQARKQLGADPAAALASTERHSREFEDGALVEERRAIGVRALAKLGRADEARREAADFLREFGDGPHADAVRRAIADDPQ